MGKSYVALDLQTYNIGGIYAGFEIYKVFKLFKCIVPNSDVVLKARGIFLCGLQILCLDLDRHSAQPNEFCRDTKFRHCVEYAAPVNTVKNGIEIDKK